MKKKAIVVTLALVIILAIGLISTIAYFTDKKELTNTFTVGNLKIELDEPNFEDGSKLLPGLEIEKDPTVTVKAGSEPAYVFMWVLEQGNIMNFLDEISIHDDWKHIDGTESLYVYAPSGTVAVVEAGDADLDLPPLFASVTVNEDLGNDEFEVFDPAADQLKVIAFAHQAYIGGQLDYDEAEAAALALVP